MIQETFQKVEQRFSLKLDVERILGKAQICIR